MPTRIMIYPVKGSGRRAMLVPGKRSMLPPVLVEAADRATMRQAVADALKVIRGQKPPEHV